MSLQNFHLLPYHCVPYVSVFDCSVSSWSSWGSCSSQCGTGRQTRQRKVTRPESNGGVSRHFKSNPCLANIITWAGLIFSCIHKQANSDYAFLEAMLFYRSVHCHYQFAQHLSHEALLLMMVILSTK